MNLYSTFRNDPFFSGMDVPSQAMPIEHRSRHDNNDRQITQRRQNDDRNPSVFENPFAMMQNMMNDMGQMRNHEPRMFSNDMAGQNGHGMSFSSSTIMSMDSRNSGQPRIIQATSEQIRGPEGFERTRKAARDTGRNLEKMETSHRLGERGHRITKERDPTTGRLVENREFEHIDNENEFEREWFNRANQYGWKNSDRNSFNAQTSNLLTTPPSSYERLGSQSQEPRYLPIESTRSDNKQKQRRRE